MRLPRFLYRIVWALDRLLDRLTRGRWDARRPGPPTLRLTTRSRRTGEPRECALYYLDHGGSFAVVASNAGSDRDPGWWLNLKARPDASVRVRGRRIPVTARQASEEEARGLGPRFDELFWGYAQYRAQTSRPLPVVIFEPVT
jgi:deazaflavin-dependent oxidoreductase (nitroreductase family)